MRNFLETFPFFAAAVITARIVNRHDWLTERGAQLYFLARIGYVALHALGVPLVRSLIWNLATADIIMILWALL
ncbi:MAPEG family protein [Bradyrhizobium jicamae]|nr:MAPEG family protein [Bradyrhizobium jicamae]